MPDMNYFFIATLFLFINLSITGCRLTQYNVQRPMYQSESSTELQTALRDVPFAKSYDAENGDPGWNPEWNSAIGAALLKESSEILLNKKTPIPDPEIFEICPRYQSLNPKQRIAFWTFLFAAMTKFESNFNPMALAPNDGGGNDSIGLLQLSYEDMVWASDWGCHVDRQKPGRKLTDPAANLECAVAIMARQVSKRAELGKEELVFVNFGDRLYWSVLSDRYTKNRENNVISSFKSKRGDDLAFCFN
ncbi:MAG: transglycosylase SLT domain-containing protein [Pseudobacteriovorax sp.]|nr:transglycosylase SLT domain-containing protein [Pseudobacteriovorax sp.]